MPGGRTAFATLPAAQIRLPGFEGPFELLLRLLDEGKLALTGVSLAAVTEQYLAVLRLLPQDALKLDALAEFLVVAAHLLLLKSRLLLPRETPPPVESEELDEATLEQRLLEYRRYRAAAVRLREWQERGERAFTRQAPPPLPPPAPPPRLEHAAPEELAKALQRLLAASAPPPETPAPPRVTLAERTEQIRRALAERSQVSFTWLASSCESRADLIITFLAVLELFRARTIQLQQDELFGEIWLLRKE